MAAASKFNWVTFVYAAILTCAFFVSCSHETPAPIPSPGPSLDNGTAAAKNVKDGMGKVADNIDKHVGTVRQNTPEAARPKVEPSLTGITSETANLRELRGKLDGAITDLASAKTEVDKLTKLNGDLVTENQKLKDEIKDQTTKAMIRLMVLCVIGIGVSAALLFTGNKLGMAIGVGCSVSLGCAVLIAKYSLFFAIGAGALLIVGLGVLGYELWKRHKVSEELVQSGELMKMGMRPPVRHYLLGNGAVPGQVDIVQSKATKDFVKKTRKAAKIRLAPSVKPVEVGQPA